jgi:hypothetical protein
VAGPHTIAPRRPPHPTVWTRTEMILATGASGPDNGPIALGDGAAYKPRTNTWRPISDEIHGLLRRLQRPAVRSIPGPAGGGPFFTGCLWRYPSSCGRWTRIVRREVRSTSVPIAERSSPISRSASRCPGTARSSASAGRSLISASGVTCAHAC